MAQTQKKINELLGNYAYKKGFDFAPTFDAWLDWIIDFWSVDNIIKNRCNLFAIGEEMKTDNPIFCDCFNLVMVDAAEQIERRGWCDAFGSIYEEKVKSGYKAASMGQFFTPDSLSQLLSDITVEGSDNTFTYDCCCGSGRLLLAAFSRLDKNKFNYFVAGDLDAISCKMTAINMMLHGMFGIVERRDALTNEFFNGYIINEMCYPFPCAIPSIRKADEAQCRANHEYAKSIAPKHEKRDVTPSVPMTPTPQVVEQPETIPQPQQLSLFNL